MNSKLFLRYSFVIVAWMVSAGCSRNNGVNCDTHAELVSAKQSAAIVYQALRTWLLLVNTDQLKVSNPGGGEIGELVLLLWNSRSPDKSHQLISLARYRMGTSWHEMLTCALVAGGPESLSDLRLALTEGSAPCRSELSKLYPKLDATRICQDDTSFTSWVNEIIAAIESGETCSPY